MLFHYREAFHLSHAEAMKEPWAEVARAHYIWSLRDKRDKLEADMREYK